MASDVPVHPEFLPFFEEASVGRLSFPRCADCGRFHWYPMKLCPHCRSRALSWQPVEPTGRLYSWTRVDFAFDRSLDVPYFVGLLEFDGAPGVRLITNLIDVEEASLDFEQEMVPDFARFDRAARRLCFRAR